MSRKKALVIFMGLLFSTNLFASPVNSLREGIYGVFSVVKGMRYSISVAETALARAGKPMRNIGLNTQRVVFLKEMNNGIKFGINLPENSASNILDLVISAPSSVFKQRGEVDILHEVMVNSTAFVNGNTKELAKIFQEARDRSINFWKMKDTFDEGGELFETMVIRIHKNNIPVSLADEIIDFASSTGAVF